MGTSSSVALVLLLGLAGSVLEAAAPPQEWPVLQMEHTAVALPQNASNVAVGVRLVGAAQAPVTANITALLLPFRNASAEDGVVAEFDDLLEPASVAWEAGSSGVRYVQLRAVLEELAVDQLLAGSRGEEGDQPQQLVVHITAATNADIVEQQSSTEVLLVDDEGVGSSGQAQEEAPVFGFLPNQVAYPPDDAAASSSPSIPVCLVWGQLTEPATLLWQLQMLTPASQQFLPTASMQGVLRFEPQQAVGQQQQLIEQRISVPVDWQRVPPQAVYRLGLALSGFYNGRALGQQSLVALHIFGVRNGTCPPGSAVRDPSPASSATTAAGDSQQQQQQQEAEQTAAVSDLALSVNGSVIDLSSAFLPSVHDYGAQVEDDVANITLCLRRSQANSSIVVTPVLASNNSSSAASEPLPEDVDEMCGCAADSLGAEDDDTGGAGAGGSSCGGYSTWQLPLQPGQNQFNISLQDLQANGSMSEQHYSLAVVRLSPPDHALLAALTLKASNGSTITLCGNSSSSSNATSSEEFPAQLWGFKMGAGAMPTQLPLCRPGRQLAVNVSYATQMVSVAPVLLHPEVLGVRVEVNGRVLSRGGNLAADVLTDTAGQQQQGTSTGDASSSDSSDSGSSQQTALTSGLLPSAFIMGMQPGTPIDVSVVVVAEDGVTSYAYPITITRMPAPKSAASVGSASGAISTAGSSSSSSPSGTVDLAAGTAAAGSPAAAMSASKDQPQQQQISVSELQQRGWPVPPALEPTCSACPAGWAASGVNASQCEMCPPGTASATAQSMACQPCQPGTYAFSWGSTHCKHCIVQTYAPSEGSTLCKLCPANWTNLEDGQASCSVPLDAAGAVDAQGQQRYAVVVSFSVYLTGVEPDDIILQAGVNAPPEAIISSLVAADTASAFNITLEAVQVLGVTQVARRTLAANVTATLGVDLPPDASEEDIAAAMEVQRLSADAPIQMLSSDPDRFFGRTTKTLDVTVHSSLPATVESRPGGGPAGPNKWALIVPGMAGVMVGTLLVFMGCKRSRRCGQWRHRAAEWLSTTPLAPPRSRYTRYLETA